MSSLKLYRLVNEAADALAKKRHKNPNETKQREESKKARSERIETYWKMMKEKKRKC